MSLNILKVLFWSVFISSVLALSTTPSVKDFIQFPEDSGRKVNQEADKLFQYYTAQAKSKIPVCKGPCGNFGKEYEWCNVTDSEWDFCSSETKTNIVFKEFSVTKGPCKGPCYQKNVEIIEDFWCEVYWGFEDKCIREKHNYVQARSVYGLECIGECKKHNNMEYFWCYDSKRTKSYCALPARVISQ